MLFNKILVDKPFTVIHFCPYYVRFQIKMYFYVYKKKCFSRIPSKYFYNIIYDLFYYQIIINNISVLCNVNI